MATGFPLITINPKPLSKIPVLLYSGQRYQSDCRHRLSRRPDTTAPPGELPTCSACVHPARASLGTAFPE